MDQANMYNAKCETMPRDELAQVQFERLQSALNRVYRNVAFYKAAFDSRRVNLERITDLRAIQELPFTTKEDLQRSYPYDMFAVPLRDIVRIHTTSGTAGKGTRMHEGTTGGSKPIVVGYTPNDLRNWRECAARLLTAAGVTQHDVVQIALHYSLFAEGFGFHQGAERIGASVIPASLTAGVAKQIVIMKDFKTTVLATTPSHALNVAVTLDEAQVRLETLSLRLGLFSGERWSDSLRRHIEERLRIQSIDTYGPTEILGPGVAGECHLRQGLHINEDQFLVEIIDPKTLVPVPEGQEGELGVTTILKEGFPLSRYRTGDITRLNPELCPCGRTFRRMAPVCGRTDDLVLVRGVGFFPAQIEAILADCAGVSPYFQIVLDQEGGLDTVQVRVEIADDIPSLDKIKAIETLRLEAARRIKATLDVEAQVIFLEPGSLRKLPGGAERVVDRRPG